MPNFDKTGPSGQGPKTGRGLGSCNGSATVNKKFNAGRNFGRGFGFFNGPGRFANCRFWPNNKKDQKQVLADYKEYLNQELAEVEKEEQNLK